MASIAFAIGWASSISEKYTAALNQIKKFWENKKAIQCVSIGPNDYFAIIYEDGSAVYDGPKQFMLKMQEFQNNNTIRNIMKISFGGSEQFAIVFKNGFCEFSLSPSIAKVVEKNNGNITYVTLTEDVNTWLVGNHRNAIDQHNIAHGLYCALLALNNSNGSIYDVQIGNDFQWIISHDKGIIGTNISVKQAKFMKEERLKCLNRRISICMYDERASDVRKKAQSLKAMDLHFLNIPYTCSQASQNTALPFKEQQHSEGPARKKRKLSNNYDQNTRQNDDDENIDVMDEKELNDLEHKYKQKLKEIQDAKEKLMDDKVRCIVCLENEKSVVIQGCNHLDLCIQCEESMSKKECPRCGKPYKGIIKVK